MDPETDTAAKLHRFVNSFNKKFIGLSASKEDTIKLEKELSVFNVNANIPIQHTTDVTLLNPKGKVRAYFPFSQSVEQIIKDYKLITQEWKNRTVSFPPSRERYEK